METYGMVKQVKGDTAVVKVARESACGGNCAACHACGNREIVTTVRNPIGAKCGDVVKISSSSRHVLGSAFILYLLPVFLFIAIYFIFSRFFNTIFTVCLSVLLVGSFYFLLKKFEKHFIVNSEIIDIIRS